MPQISIIVPVYKVENYLERCVNSLLAQTWHDIEIILVDDGSPDNSGAICDEFAEKDPRVKVVHKENGGLSSARNAGLAIATGNYIGFVDSDDYVLPEMYEKLHLALTESDAEISICNYEYIDEETGQCIPTNSPVKTEVLSREKAYACLDVGMDGYSYYVTAWNKLYKKELFEGCLFVEGKIHEDEFFVHHVFAKCNQIAVIDDKLYMYMQRNGSITNTHITIKHLDGVYAFCDRYEFFRSIKKKELATSLLHAALWKLDTLASHLQNKENAAAVNKAFLTLFKLFMGRFDRKIILLFIYWLGYWFNTLSKHE